MKAIMTRYLGPTNFRGARIKANDEDGNTITISYPYNEPNREEGHRKAAEALCIKMGWIGNLVAGSTQRGYVFVFAD